MTDQDFPKIVCLVGSTRFKKSFEKIARRETLKGHIVLTVHVFGHLENLDMEGEVKAKLDKLHLKQIKMADEIIAINEDGYVGEGTEREIIYAQKLGKLVVTMYCGEEIKYAGRTFTVVAKMDYGAEASTGIDMASMWDLFH